MEIKIPAKALRAAQLCTYKDESRRILQGVCVYWGSDHEWEIAATDSVKLFNAWGQNHGRLVKHLGSVVIDPKDLELKVKDVEVVLNTTTLQADVYAKNSAVRSYALEPIEAQTDYPDVHALIGDLSAVHVGHIGSVSAEHLEVLCKITKIWNAKNNPMQFFTPCEGVKRLELRPVVVKWPVVGTPHFHCFGLIMPIWL